VVEGLAWRRLTPSTSSDVILHGWSGREGSEALAHGLLSFTRNNGLGWLDYSDAKSAKILLINSSVKFW